MSFTLDTWSILLIISIAHGLFVLSLMLMKSKWYKPPASLLTGLVLTLIWLQIEFFSIRSPFNVGFNLFYGTRYGSWMLLGPLYFLYLKTTLRPDHQLVRKDLLHFLPFIIFGVMLPLFSGIALQEPSGGLLSWRQVHYGMLTPFDSFNQKLTILNYLYGGVFIFQFLHLGIYLLAGEGLIRSYKAKLEETNSSFQSNIRWLRGLNLTMLAVILFVSTFLTIFFFTNIYRRHLDYLYVIPLATIIYVIAYRLIKVSLPNETIPIASNGKKYEKSSLTGVQLEAYAQMVREYLVKEKPYLQNGLRLKDLALALNIPPYHLSQVINSQMKTSFFDLINSHRITEAQTLIKTKTDAALLEIAYEAGFNNKTSFVNAFKKHSGKTPSAYRRQILSKS